MGCAASKLRTVQAGAQLEVKIAIYECSCELVCANKKIHMTVCHLMYFGWYNKD
jgi:hypothetical protein